MIPSKKELTERDICTKFITPAIKNAGWNTDTQMLEEENVLTTFPTTNPTFQLPLLKRKIINTTMVMAFNKQVLNRVILRLLVNMLHLLSNQLL